MRTARRSTPSSARKGWPCWRTAKLRWPDRKCHAQSVLWSSAGPASEYRLATAEDNLAILRLRQRKFADAERLLNDALSIEQRLPSRPVFETNTTMELLAQLRKAQRRDAAAVRPGR